MSIGDTPLKSLRGRFPAAIAPNPETQATTANTTVFEETRGMVAQRLDTTLVLVLIS
jgi:hypothetical protein